jgi:glyoxylase-like metal-dependent hydrolase (beta-lactamase superfamily II)
MKEYTIVPLTVGANETDQGIMTYLKDYGQRIWIPIYVFVLRGGDKNILVDTGLEEFIVPDDFEERFGIKVMEFEDALASVGLKPQDIDVIIHTHLHNDHCENDYKCRNAKVYVQKKELDFMQDPHPIDHRYFPDILEGVEEIVELDGDAKIMDGISVMFTPGHSPGGQSVVVNTSAGRAIITGFCCNDKNFPERGPVICPGVHTDAIAAYDSLVRVKNEADIIIPVHDLNIGRLSSIP